MDATPLDLILDHSREVNPRAVLCYLLVCQEVEAGRPFPRLPWLSQRLHVENRMARRYLAELRECGALEYSDMHVRRIPALDMTAVAR